MRPCRFAIHVSGVVREQGSGRPLLDLVVRAYDADVVADDFLGETRTDADGRFDRSSSRRWRSATSRRRTPTSISSSSTRGTQRVLHSTRGELRKNAGVEERYAIEIPAPPA